MLLPIIGERVKSIRKNKKKTQKELGDSSCISKQVISNIERGVTTTVNEYVLYLLSKSLETSKDYLSGYTDNPYFEEENIKESDLVREFKTIVKPHNEVLLRKVSEYLQTSDLEIGRSLLENTIELLNTSNNNKLLETFNSLIIIKLKGY